MKKARTFESKPSVKPFFLTILLIGFIFLRFFDLEGRMQFTWDQVSNAWVMKDMIVEGKFPLEGMVAKLNSGIRIGPAYYYLLFPFYRIFDLDPIASAVFAGFVSLGFAAILFYSVKRIFSTDVALISLAIWAFSSRIIMHDRIAWPVILLPLTAVVVYFSLVRIIRGESRYLVLLAGALGFSLHVHFTAIFLFINAICILPFTVRTRGFWGYAAKSIPVFFIWTIPWVMAQLKMNFTGASGFASYIQTYYHGLHFVRVMQLVPDALLEFGAVIGISWLSQILIYTVLPLFLFIYYRLHKTREGLLTGLLTALWFIVPLIVFSLYRGEISDYYFTVTRPVAVMIYAYLTVVMAGRGPMMKIALGLLWGYIFYYNIQTYLTNNYGNHVPQLRAQVLEAIGKDRRLEFTEGDPKSYLYYYYAEYKGRAK